MRFVGCYEIKKRLGRGAFGDVYRAVHRDTGEEVAGKCIAPKKQRFVEMTKKEIMVILNFPNRVKS